ncbi:hypothetical protein ANN_16980 [Periplaneta americana]|uniref:DDE Tnp4 domain-containing protein n=1 Tax=Periplaneta americana TaxID=6978 RepID=A0ABQ8SSF8_PERAM|nr:hypothetical protein ANN_16980 [Periplaneta americana]
MSISEEWKFKNILVAIDLKWDQKDQYLASGNTFTDLHYTYRMGISTIALIVRQVCEVIWEVMAEECLPEPTLQKWQEIAFGFQTKANFPNCIGALDGKHIRVIKPIKSGSLFMNYKHYFSIALLGICDSNYCFIYIDVGAYGRNSDSTVFKDSGFWKKLEANQVSIPSWKPLPDTSEPLLPQIYWHVKVLVAR